MALLAAAALSRCQRPWATVELMKEVPYSCWLAMPVHQLTDRGQLTRDKRGGRAAVGRQQATRLGGAPPPPLRRGAASARREGYENDRGGTLGSVVGSKKAELAVASANTHAHTRAPQKPLPHL
jgi:hypothetical protein